MTQRVLVADDVAGVRESLAVALEAAGMAVEKAGTGRAALARLAAAPFDVLVTDIWMPDGDGLNLIKATRAAHPTLRVFAMTGGGAHMTIETASSLAEVWGAEWVFVKPFDEDLLVEKIRAGAGSRTEG